MQQPPEENETSHGKAEPPHQSGQKPRPPQSWWRRIIWFLTIWVLSVLALGVVSLALRFLFKTTQ